MGPVFGMKGGAAGGGYSQVVPMSDINLQFTGDFTAIAAANNLLAALIDNHVHHGNELDIDVRTITWKRVVDLNDRALRQITVALGGVANGYPREDGFDIVVASELMAIFCLTESWADLKQRIGDIVVGYTRAKQPVTARDLNAHGAMTVILRDALMPNLVQTLEHAPAFVHGGPFANIAHGCSSVIATRPALRLADYVVTEAGFGADLGAEKFVDIKCRKSGPAAGHRRRGRDRPRAQVPRWRRPPRPGSRRTSTRSTRGWRTCAGTSTTSASVYGVPCVVAINRFPSDTDAGGPAGRRPGGRRRAWEAFPATHFAEGGDGATDLAKGVLRQIDGRRSRRSPSPTPTRLPDREGRDDRVAALRRRGGDLGPRRPADGWPASRPTGTAASPCAWRRRSTPSRPTRRSAAPPAGHALHVREVRLSAGAGFVVMVCGDMMTMPGLPSVPGVGAHRPPSTTAPSSA